MPSEVTKYVGRRIAVAREEAGLSQRELAKALGVRQPTVANWELGKREPELSQLVHVARHFQLPVVAFLPWQAADLDWLAQALKELPSEDRRRLCEAMRQACRGLEV